MTPVAARFDFNPWEHFRVQRALGAQSRWRFVFYGFVIGLPLVTLGLLWLGRSAMPGGSLGLGDVWYLLIPIVLALVVLPLAQVYTAFAHRRQHRIPHTEHFVELNEEGVRAGCVAMTSEVRWEALHSARETKEFFLLYYSPKCAFYLPKRSLGGASGEAEARRSIRRHMGERARLLAPAG